MLAFVGRTRDREIAGLIDRYVERAGRMARVEIRVVQASRAARPERRRRDDSASLLRACRPGASVLLSPAGAAWTSEKVASYLRDRLVRASLPTTFAVAGEEGLDDESWADERVSLGRMTLPHELARVILAEQVYRGLTIIHNVKYHK